MKLKKLNLKIRKWTGLLVFSASIASASAQSGDALIDKLVEKGILTVKEANDLREEVDKNFTQATSAKSGMPEWVTAMKFTGDLRARYDGIYSDAQYISGGTTNSFANRNRARYRLRFGATVTMFDNLEAGFRLTSGDPAGGFSTGNPLSGNSTFQDNGTKKFVFVDLAYGKWYPLNGPNWTMALTVGKMENPFVFDEMVFDPDYTPEGMAMNLGYRINDHHSLKLNGGAFVLDEVLLDRDDPYMLGAQLRWDASWNTHWASSLGISELVLGNGHSLSNNAVPNINRGNTRNADGTLTRDYYPWVVDGSVTYTVSSFPCYNGPFPIKFGGEYMNNPGAPSDGDKHYGWNAGITFGKSGKKRTWELAYTYRWLGADAWYEEFEDDDFGAFYGGVPLSDSPPFSGQGFGYGSGTGVKGHVVRFAYSPTDSWTLSVKYFLTELIDPFPATGIGSDSRANRLFVDATWKF
jgi:hypothetical protein